MSQLVALFPDIDLDLLAELIEESTPWFQAWACVIGLLLAGVVAQIVAEAVCRRAPVEKMLRRRFG